MGKLFRAFLGLVIAFFSSSVVADDGPSGKTICGYAPHNHVYLLDHDWHLWLPYPSEDPRRQVIFGTGLRSFRGQADACSRLFIAAGEGIITWSGVTIEVKQRELLINGKVVPMRKHLAVDTEGNVYPDMSIRTFD